MEVRQANRSLIALSEGVEPPASAMFRGTLDHVTPLIERDEVVRSIVPGIVVQVRAGENRARDL